MDAPRRCVGALALLLLLGACASGPERSSAPAANTSFAPSGFLGDYSALRPGAGNQPRLVHLDAAADYSRYERVIIDPVVVWKSDEARFAGVPAAQREALARAFDTELERALAAEFEIVEGPPGPGTLRVRNALTAAVAGSETSDPRKLRYIEVELELLDALTNERIAAAVDAKGSDSPGQGLANGVEPEAAFEDWAERLAVRLAALRDFDRRQRQPDAR